jgi:hypothetical protein
MSEPKIYVGKGKAGKYGTKISVCLTDLPKEHINDFNGKKYINLEITEMKTPDKFGKTHTVTVDTWKPDTKASEPDNSLNPAGDDLPF